MVKSLENTTYKEEQTMNRNKWHMNRMGLVDFWYYTNEEFDFADGHILLRGSNGSGKSVTMQSFIPLLLDGNKSSERLDAFGSKARKMDTYLLEENSERDDRIGYLYLEFKKEDSELYKTIGIGLHAKANRPLISWYFVIEDNKRVNIDFSLMENHLGITKQVLKNIIGEQVIESQTAYAEKVNQALFGFETMEDYREMINLLLQLRSPKLSNSLKPSLINELLSDSLQPLSEDDLRPMSEALSNMDTVQDQLLALKESYSGALSIKQVYDSYNVAIYLEKARKTLIEEANQKQLEKNQNDVLKQLKKDRNDQINNEKMMADFTQENELLEEEKRTLQKDDILAISEDLEKSKQDLGATQFEKETKTKQLDKKNNDYQDLRIKEKRYNDLEEKNHEEINQNLIELDDIQIDLQFNEHELFKSEFLNNFNHEQDFHYSKKRINEEMKIMDEALAIFQTMNQETLFLNELIDRKEQCQNQIEEDESNLKKAENTYIETVENYKETIYRWHKQNEILKLSEQDLNTAYEFCIFYDQQPSAFADLMRIIHSNRNTLMDRIAKDKAETQLQLNQINDDIEENQREQNEWLNKREPMPIRDESTLNNRQYLQELSVDFKPFYSILDFDETLSDEKRSAIEETLNRLGLLDSLLIHEDDKEKVLNYRHNMADNYLFTTTLIENISIHLIHDTDENDLLTSLMEILLALGCIKNEKVQLKQGIFHYDFLYGTISGVKEAIFIGENSREKYKLKMIEELRIMIENLSLKKRDIEARLAEINRQEATLISEYEAFIKEDELKIALEMIHKIEKVLVALYEDRLLIEKKQQVSVNKIKALQLNVQEKAEKLGVNATQEVFIHRKVIMSEYARSLNDLQTHHTSYLKHYELRLNTQNSIDIIILDIDQIRYENEKLSTDIEKLKGSIFQKEKILREKGYEKIQERLSQIRGRLSEIKKKTEEILILKGSLASTIENNEARLKTLEKDYQQQSELVKKYQQIIQEELNQHYLDEFEIDIKSLYTSINQLEKRMPSLKSVQDCNNSLQQTIFAKNAQLREYNLTTTNILEQRELGMNARIDLSAKYQGRKIKFHELLSHLLKDIKTQQNLLNEKDVILFQDILVNIIGKKVRSRIHKSRTWVDNMNKYMNAMNTSSGLKLSLLWKSKKAESDDELDTKMLVDLLEKDPISLKDSDRNKLVDHFKSKIDKARDISQEENSKVSLHQSMRFIMDYRKWFEFKILSQKTNETKKELTNNLFNAFSGGEKAMAMYVPLFSAVAAKFEGARDEAPLIIALDEAFAGVDEKNIHNMFELIGKFEFDYIMNSQILWGDYASVSALAIYELFRPENVHFVTIIAYLWNGNEKVKVNKA